MGTVRELVSDALAEIGAIASGETLSANDGALALRKLNRMLDSWKTRKLYVFSERIDEYTITATRASYSIGTSGTPNFSGPRPTRIISASLILTANTPDSSVPLEVLDVDGWNEISTPALESGLPQKLYYQATVPNGTIYLYPRPTELANKIEITHWLAVDIFSSLDDSVVLPPGYEEAIVYSLAEGLCPSFGREVSASLAGLANRARVAIQALNSSSPRMGTDYPAGAGSFDYSTGGL